MSAAPDYQPVASPATADPRYAATLQHIGLIANKRTSLLALQVEAERQLIHRIAVDYAAGILHPDDLADLYMAYKTHAGSGFTHRWDAEMPLTAAALADSVKHARRANGPARTWVGVFPLDQREPAPMRRVNVVYVLFDATNVPCYVGSTKDFRGRLGDHGADKTFARWQAYPCVDRETAYVTEERLLREHKPYLNRRVGR